MRLRGTCKLTKPLCLVLKQRGVLLQKDIESSDFFPLTPLNIPSTAFDEYVEYTKNCITYNQIKKMLCPILNAKQFREDELFEAALNFALQPEPASRGTSADIGRLSTIDNVQPMGGGGILSFFGVSSSSKK